MRSWLALLLLLAPVTLWAADSAPRVQSQLREIDHTVGDIVRQTLTIDTPRGYRLDESTLPRPGSGKVIEVRKIQTEFNDLKSITRHVVIMDWQVFMALREIRPVPLLDIDLQFLRDGKVLPVHIPAAQVIISPLLPTKMTSEFLVPQADVAPKSSVEQPYLLTFAAAMAWFLISVLGIAWYLGLLHTPKDVALPFRQAWQDIRKLRRGKVGKVIARVMGKAADDDRVEEAMRLLIRAFDRYTGYSVNTENLAQVFEQHSRLQAHQPFIQAFYHDVERVFFGEQPAMQSLDHLERFARHLSRRLAA